MVVDNLQDEMRFILNHILDRPTSFAKLLTGELNWKSVNFRTLIEPAWNGADVAITFESIRAINKHYANTVYGFFLEIRVAYPVVDKYLKNTWSKYGLWNPGENLLKENVGNVLVWVKFHGVHVTVFTDDGLSTIASTLGTPLMLDFYTSDMCMQSRGDWEAVLNMTHGSSSTTPILEKIDKLERKILDGKFMFVDDDGKPLYKADFTGIANSDSEVEEVPNETACYMALTSLKRASEKAICDDFDITVYGRKKKYINLIFVLVNCNLVIVVSSFEVIVLVMLAFATDIHCILVRVRSDAYRSYSIDPILKCTSAIRQMAYGTAPDAFDEYLQIAERTSRECLSSLLHKCISRF
ncbi:hypothetical protein Tco_1505945 [Tanacetum coccineum]